MNKNTCMYCTVHQLHVEKNHLGNALATVSDKKIGEDSDGNGWVNYYQADVMSTQSYYPYGMLQPGRSYNPTESRWGYNNNESDDEVYGTKNFYDYGKRMYDPRLARFPSVDPLIVKEQQYAWLSPYQYANNSL